MTLYVDCPRGCGWPLNPAFEDETGLPYSCYCCCNTGQVRIDEADAYSKALAKQEDDYTEPVQRYTEDDWNGLPIDDDIPY